MRFLFFPIFLSTVLLQAQIEEIDSTYYQWPAIEVFPVYPGCDSLKRDYRLKKCMNAKIRTLISKNFDTLLFRSLDLPDGLIKIKTFYEIDTLGKVTNIKVSGPHTKLEEEAKRVIQLIPRMSKPATNSLKPISMIYRLPIYFNVNNSDKKEKK
ncbi:energy transducer TonB [Seonamhaeicola sp. MEBiC1930]|uniref:hypothetical protein n=1 Tax=Seonamhaeicola sp. MEBiC01930 TaxID=2976768 RepID=UPI003252E469